jgi:hypothetical protein
MLLHEAVLKGKRKLLQKLLRTAQDPNSTYLTKKLIGLRRV